MLPATTERHESESHRQDEYPYDDTDPDDNMAITSLAMLTTLRKPEQQRTSLFGICKAFQLERADCGRVAKYLGNISKSDYRETVYVDGLVSQVEEVKRDKVFAMKIADFHCSNETGPSTLGSWPRLHLYADDFCDACTTVLSVKSLQYISKRVVLFIFGDSYSGKFGRQFCAPTLVKSRSIPDLGQSVLLRMASKRHWRPIEEALAVDVPFSQKVDKLIWRGASTGLCDASKNNTRMMFVSKFFGSTDRRIDVGFSDVVQKCSAGQAYKKDKLSKADLLKARYLIVLNGNDKASALNWILASNSVPFMPAPTLESWLLESTLQAWVHYVPLEPDFSDVVSKLDWITKNRDAGERIATASRQYINKFLDRKKEGRIQAAVITAYLDRVSIVTKNKIGEAQNASNAKSIDMSRCVDGFQR